MERGHYRVTDAAGPRPEVAGHRRRAGETVRLSPAEAEYELLRGVVEAVPAGQGVAPDDARAAVPRRGRSRTAG